MWAAYTLRNDLWHRRDMRQKLALIRFMADRNKGRPPKGDAHPSWNPILDQAVHTGPSVALSLATDLGDQVDWLVREDPVYLLTFPTNLHALALRFRDQGRSLPRLQGITTVGETLTEDTRVLVREVFGAEISDMYSCQEMGYIALNCPDHPGYHVQSESVLVEVLDESGAPCQPGEVGRLVATSLTNWASPFIRYEIGDYAEVSEPCPCGRGLPRLRRILGRARNMLHYPDGRVSWPYIESTRCLAAAPYRQMQLVQVDAETIQVNIVPVGELTAHHRAALTSELQRSLGHPFQIRFQTVEAVERSRGGKFEEFVSLVDHG
jgi:phenylacetate-CoA ligase